MLLPEAPKVPSPGAPARPTKDLPSALIRGPAAARAPPVPRRLVFEEFPSSRVARGNGAAVARGDGIALAAWPMVRRPTFTAPSLGQAARPRVFLRRSLSAAAIASVSS